VTFHDFKKRGSLQSVSSTTCPLQFVAREQHAFFLSSRAMLPRNGGNGENFDFLPPADFDNVPVAQKVHTIADMVFMKHSS
jgi:hypothetical protein